MQKTTPEFFEWLLPIKSCTLDGAKQSNLASVRLRAALSCEALEKHGYLTAFSYGHPSKRSRAIYVGKFSDADDPQRAPRWLDFLSNKKRVGSRIIIDYTDNHLATNSRATLFYKDAFKLADAVVCSSNVLAKHVRSYIDLPITIIPDPIEVDIEPPLEKNNPRPTALWFGHASNLSYFLSFISKLKTFDHPLDIIAITNISPIPEDALKQIESAISPLINVSFLGWSPEVLTAAGKIADFCIIPAGLHDPKKDGASSNRLMTALAMGLPVLADPLDSYLPFKDFFETLDVAQLGKAVSEPLEQRFEQVRQAQKGILKEFTQSAISNIWLNDAIERIQSYSEQKG